MHALSREQRGEVLRQVTMVSKSLDDNKRAEIIKAMTMAIVTRTAKKPQQVYISETTLHMHHAFFVHFLAVAAQL